VVVFGAVVIGGAAVMVGAVGTIAVVGAATADDVAEPMTIVVAGAGPDWLETVAVDDDVVLPVGGVVNGAVVAGGCAVEVVPGAVFPAPRVELLDE